MANDNNIKTFTALDIEKYHKGLLSPKEMHALEKAALDDPFLADALEGYATEGVNINNDIAELKKRLADKTEQAKIILMHPERRSSFRWLRVAVLFVLIAGAGLLSWQFLFKSSGKDNEIAQAPINKEKDSLNALPVTTNRDTSENKAATSKVSDLKTNEQKNIATETGKKNNDDKASVTYKLEEVDATKDIPVSSPLKSTEEKEAFKKTNDLAKQRSDSVARQDAIVANVENKNKSLNKPVATDADGVTDKYDKANAETVVTGYGTTKRKETAYTNTNVFRGRVTDANNNALPFANVTITRDNVGTYSDAQGNFALVSPDSVLNVQVRSLGFENSNVQLRGQVATNQVMMQEDRSLNAKILDTVKRNISRSRSNTMTFEEPEPADGWDSYGAYVANNVNIPETFEKKPSGIAENTVEVSFEVNKDGNPVKIKVEKSLCDKCDKEAIRLIKEGPKWKRKAKKGKRTTVAVPFNKTE